MSQNELETIAAIAHFSEAIKMNPNHPKAYVDRASVRDKLGNIKGAIADLTKAIEINSKDEQSYNNRDANPLLFEYYQGIMADLTKAIEETNPDNVRAYIYCGLSRICLKDYQAAIANFTKAIEIDFDNINAYSYRGLTRALLGDKQGAITDLQQSVFICQQHGRQALAQQILENIANLA